MAGAMAGRMSAARRFYKHAAAVEAGGGWGVRLDERTLRTPAGAVFVAPTRALAEAVAAEWNAQGEQIAPATMPLSQFAFAALDITPGRRAELSQALSKYIEADLVCHRAEGPEALIARQAETWNPIVAWAEQRLQIPLPVVTGVIAADARDESRRKLQAEIGALDDFRCTALAQAATLAGSVLIGFALLEGRVDAAQAFTASALDELWSLEHWGEDSEARARLDRLERDLHAVARFIATLRM